MERQGAGSYNLLIRQLFELTMGSEVNQVLGWMRRTSSLIVNAHDSDVFRHDGVYDAQSQPEWILRRQSAHPARDCSCVS